MNRSQSRILIFAGLSIVLLLMVLVLFSWVLWGWPPFEVKGFSWN